MATAKTKRPNKQTLGVTFRGVDLSTYKSGGTWDYSFRARLNGKYLGSFNTAEEAAMAYNKAAKKAFRTEKAAKKMGCWNEI